MPYGIILLPDTRTSARLVAYARSIARDVPTIMCVDEVRRPHLTLRHVDCDRAEAAELWGRTCATVPAELPVVLSGTQIAAFATGDPYVPQGGVYVGSEALRSADLDAAHREVLRHARELSLGTLTSAGADYRPHVTLAVLETTDRVLVPVPPQELSVPFTGHLAWGAMGPYGTFPDIIEIRNAAAT